MGGGGYGRVPFENTDSAKHCLGDHESKGCPTQTLRKRTLFGPREPNGKDQRENGNKSGEYAMRVFVANTSHERGDDPVVGERPIGNGIRSVIAGDERTGNEKQDRAAGSCYGKPINTTEALCIGH